jgi:RNA polymerase sigma factor (sigma-70 family)
MELTDEQWTQVRAVAEAKAMQMTHGDHVRSQDLAAAVVERLLMSQAEIADGRLSAYVREMVKNAYLDQRAKQDAAYRGGPSLKHPMDEEIHAIAAEVAGVFQYSLLSKSPSAKFLRREQDDARAAAYQEILASLPERKRSLVRMAAEGYSHKDIAQALGYANAGVVKTTLHRVYKDIRERFDLRASDYFSQAGQ